MIRPAEAYGAFNERKAYEPKIIPKDLVMAREHRMRLIEVMVTVMVIMVVAPVGGAVVGQAAGAVIAAAVVAAVCLSMCQTG